MLLQVCDGLRLILELFLDDLKTLNGLMILKHMLSLNLAKAFSTFKHLERTVLLDMLHQLLFIELFAACASEEGVWA